MPQVTPTLSLQPSSQGDSLGHHRDPQAPCRNNQYAKQPAQLGHRRHALDFLHAELCRQSRHRTGEQADPGKHGPERKPVWPALQRILLAVRGRRGGAHRGFPEDLLQLGSRHPHDHVDPDHAAADHANHVRRPAGQPHCPRISSKVPHTHCASRSSTNFSLRRSAPRPAPWSTRVPRLVPCSPPRC